MTWARRLVAPVLGIAMVGAALYAIWRIPQYQGAKWAGHVPNDQLPELVNQFRQTTAQVVGGAALLLGLYLTWRRTGAAERTIEVERDRHVTERYTRAIDQLAHDRVEVRMGGIYALERIAHDSAKDAATIVEVLSAFVRERAPIKAEQPDLERRYGSGPQGGRRLVKTTIATDVQAAVSVLGRYHRSSGAPRATIDLQFTDLRTAVLEGADFSGAKLQGARFDEAALQDTSFVNADLRGTDFSLSRMHRVNLAGTRISDANFSDADLAYANFAGATISGCKATHAIFAFANLRGATIEGGNFASSGFHRADFTDARVSGMEGADLTVTNLTEAQCEHVKGVTMFSMMKMARSAARNEGQSDQPPREPEPPSSPASGS
jgi:hypothetical protein